MDDSSANEENRPADEASLPRQNGELVFSAPWEARAFGLAVALNEEGRYVWGDFSRGLAAQVTQADADGSDSVYYERWLQALEKLLLERGLVDRAELEARIEQVAHQVEHEHSHEHGHGHGHDHD
ncbi:MAG: nitrile hydratase accessory protein [Candidatus Latescibacteria bacterium]|nr:nitrile hydratase accessory protein [Candidatus Latescibacterota bacterium]